LRRGQALQQGGFDGCEVMASHCHLIDQFWTLNVNRRTDQYGGDLANRLRFGIRIIEAVHEPSVGTSSWAFTSPATI
jgi:2,4-dienoyl-CoA reductase-like NADH-dependent reductase (Old Yellow Enzyme family)